MEKYGFVYIWYDHKKKMYYVGCHWGTEDDGYICSSSWMMKSYKRRKKDFKRRVLKCIYTNRRDLLEEEYKWLSFIKKEELHNRYYNLHNHHFNHWSINENSKLTVREKISKSTKEAMQRPEVRKRLLDELHKYHEKHPEHRKNHSKKMTGRKATQETRNKMSISQKKRVYSEERNKAVSEALKKYFEKNAVSELTRKKLSENAKKQWQLRKRCINGYKS